MIILGAQCCWVQARKRLQVREADPRLCSVSTSSSVLLRFHQLTHNYHQWWPVHRYMLSSAHTYSNIEYCEDCWFVGPPVESTSSHWLALTLKSGWSWKWALGPPRSNAPGLRGHRHPGEIKHSRKHCKVRTEAWVWESGTSSLGGEYFFRDWFSIATFFKKHCKSKRRNREGKSWALDKMFHTSWGINQFICMKLAIIIQSIVITVRVGLRIQREGLCWATGMCVEN